MNTMLPDLRHGWRLLTRNRGSTAVVLLTLALGIGANASLYSIARAVLLKPLPFSGGDRLGSPRPAFFSSTMTLVGRVKKGATTGPAALRQAIWTVDPGLPIELRTMRERLDEAALQPRVGAWILGLFA